MPQSEEKAKKWCRDCGQFLWAALIPHKKKKKLHAHPLHRLAWKEGLPNVIDTFSWERRAWIETPRAEIGGTCDVLLSTEEEEEKHHQNPFCPQQERLLTSSKGRCASLFFFNAFLMRCCAHTIIIASSPATGSVCWWWINLHLFAGIQLFYDNHRSSSSSAWLKNAHDDHWTRISLFFLLLGKRADVEELTWQ